LPRKSQNWRLLVGIAALTLIADWVTKRIIVGNLVLYETRSLPIQFLERIASLTYITNTGAAFGLFPSQGALFVAIAAIVVASIIFYYRHLPAGYGLTRLALGLQLGGVLGNLIDRLRQGYVVDFIDLNFWPLQDWPVFNVADSAIVVGVSLLALTMLFEDTEDQEKELLRSEGDTASEPSSPS
jgi:signal peptidase II